MEKKTTHTPGPWRVGPQPNGCIRGTEHLKSVWAEKPGGLNGDLVEYNVAENCDEADARLIAAAPELLDALNVLVESHSLYIHASDDREYGAKLKSARAAILRATEGK